MWEWHETRWVLRFAPDRQLDVESTPNHHKLWYRRGTTRSLLIGTYPAADMAREAGLELVKQLVRTAEMVT